MPHGLLRTRPLGRPLRWAATLSLGMLFIPSGAALADLILSPTEALTDLRSRVPRTEVDRQLQDVLSTDLASGDYAKALVPPG